MSPLFDIYCNNCKETNETIGEFDRLKCPNCGSKDIKRRWVGSPMIKIVWDVQGSTKGVREKAKEIMRKENEKIKKGGYG